MSALLRMACVIFAANWRLRGVQRPVLLQLAGCGMLVCHRPVCLAGKPCPACYSSEALLPMHAPLVPNRASVSCPLQEPDRPLHRAP